MKKILLISHLILYTAFNAGVLINLHFCGRTFQHFTVFVEPDDCCKRESHSCCNTSSTELKVAADYDRTETSINELFVQFLSGPHPFIDEIAKITRFPEGGDLQSSGPLIEIQSHPIYLVNRVFRI